MHLGAGYSLENGADGDAELGDRLVFSGSLMVSTIGAIDQDVRTLDGPLSSIDVSGVEEMDTVGAWTVLSISREHNVEIFGADDRASRLIEAVSSAHSDADVLPERTHIFERVPLAVGKQLSGWMSGLLTFLSFLGGLIVAIGSVIRHPRRFRMKALIRQMELVGVSSLGIIGLMSFLIGIVISQQGAVQLAQFGAEALTVNLTGRISLRELGVLMTAIMVAGRSGSAFAAQIGTMKLTEEVDAMRTIGISPMEALVLPRILAATFMMPLLGAYAAGMAIVGGAFIADVSLGIPFMTFLSRIQEVVPTYDLWVGLLKAPVFGLIIGLAGCYQGMQVKDNSEQVGKRTTAAVVQAIFMVIVLDAFFAVFFTELGWA
ncbi:ABC transporter permease [Altererythrobacter sp. ZODW24]|uniref:MlaE family ABC transporter permease n=1 Tax=Altererythrobacter sp. ZODW24 TaxID=2185142 RepID=UPI000DF869B6|nr:ABC transporter permease [Altererythrobacter sp. ZODW24]